MESQVATPVRPLRRGIVELLLGGGLFASFVSFVYPVLRYLVPPPVPELGGDEVIAGKIAELKPNGSKIFRFGTRSGVFADDRDGEYRAFPARLHAFGLHRAIPRRPAADLVCLPQRTLRSQWPQCLGSAARPLEDIEVHVRGDEMVVSRKREA